MTKFDLSALHLINHSINYQSIKINQLITQSMNKQIKESINQFNNRFINE